MSRTKGQTVTLGYTYSCGLCKKKSRTFTTDKGMKMWCRLHFKKNPACKTHHKKFGLGENYSNSYRDMAGQEHLVRSGRTGLYTEYAKELAGLGYCGGHNKFKNKEDMEDLEQTKEYIADAEFNCDKLLLMASDIKTAFKDKTEDEQKKEFQKCFQKQFGHHPARAGKRNRNSSK